MMVNNFEYLATFTVKRGKFNRSEEKKNLPIVEDNKSAAKLLSQKGRWIVANLLYQPT